MSDLTPGDIQCDVFAFPQENNRDIRPDLTLYQFLDFVCGHIIDDRTVNGMNDIACLYTSLLCRRIAEDTGNQVQAVCLTLKLYTDSHEVAVNGLRKLHDLFTGHIGGVRIFFVGCHSDKCLIRQPTGKVFDILCEVPVFLQDRPDTDDLVFCFFRRHISDLLPYGIGKRCRHKRTETPADQQCKNCHHDDPAGGSAVLFFEPLIFFYKLIFILKTFYRYLIRYLETVTFLFRFAVGHSISPKSADDEKNVFCAWNKYIAFPLTRKKNP